jgi:hypothetical protein
MKITICGSINFALEMIKIKGDLEKKDHQVNIPYFVKKIRNGEYSYEEYINKKRSGILILGIQKTGILSRGIGI